MIIAEFLRLQKSLFAPPARNRRRENKRICSGNAFLMFFTNQSPVGKETDLLL